MGQASFVARCCPFPHLTRASLRPAPLAHGKERGAGARVLLCRYSVASPQLMRHLHSSTTSHPSHSNHVEEVMRNVPGDMAKEAAVKAPSRPSLKHVEQA